MFENTSIMNWEIKPLSKLILSKDLKETLTNSIPVKFNRNLKNIWLLTIPKNNLMLSSNIKNANK